MVPFCKAIIHLLLFTKQGYNEQSTIFFITSKPKANKYQINTMKYGYARCSTNETKQDIQRQVRELKGAGAEEIFLEYEHGDSKIKNQQKAMFSQTQAGDTIITLEVPRLARSTQQLCEIIDLVREKHLHLVIVGSISLDCREGQADPMSEAFLQMAGVFSQLELAMIRSRVRSGIRCFRYPGLEIETPG